MSRLQNLSDFRDEWVFLCGTGNELQNVAVQVSGECEVLCEALRRVLCSHGAVQGDAVQVCLKDRILQAHAQQGTMYLALPPIYGAGMPQEYDINAEHEDSVHVADVLCAIVRELANFSVGRRNLCLAEKPLITKEDGLRMLRLFQADPDRVFYDDLAYEGNLRALQEKELQLLLEFDRICRSNDISYFLGGGTLLGAIRHQGFIPWDDDVDVMMDRENFDRLMQLAPQSVGENFFYQNSTTDPNYHSPFHKLRAENTLFVTEFSQRFEMEQGIALDVFAHDATSKSPKWRKLHIFLTTFARSMVFHKWDGSPMHFYGKKKLLCRMASFFVRHTSMKRLESIERRVMTHYNQKNTGIMYDGMGEHLQHGGFDAKILQKSTTAMFEGHAFPVPQDYDAYLKFSYGEDYMTLPRPGLRRAHHSAVRFFLGEK